MWKFAMIALVGVSPPSDCPLAFESTNGPLVVVHQQGTIDATVFGGELISTVISGIVDTQPVEALEGLAPGTICSLWACVPCPDGSGNSCNEQSLYLDGSMPQVGLTLVPRTAAEIAVDPSCP